MDASIGDIVQVIGLVGGVAGMVFLAGRVFAKIEGLVSDLKSLRDFVSADVRGLRESMEKWGARLGAAEVAIGSLQGILTDRSLRGS